MAINLFTKYQDKLAGVYTHESFVKGKTSNEWSWAGNKTIKIMSILTQDLNDYDRTATANRYGTPNELQDVVQELPVTQDKSFSIVIDDGNNTQQGMLKQAGKVMKMQIAEKVVPTIDKYALGKWAEGAGKVVGAAAPTKDTIISALVDAETAFADALVPTEERYAYLPNEYVGMFRQSLTSLDTVTDRILLKGVVGQFGTLKIVGIPAAWLPEGVYMLVTQKRSVVLAEQINKALVHENPQGYSGNVLEGRYLYDAFVIGAHAEGCYALVDSSKALTAPSITKGTSTSTIASADGATIKYTVDGSDPRYSNSAQTYSAAVPNPAAGRTLKAACVKDGSYMSGVASLTF